MTHSKMPRIGEAGPAPYVVPDRTEMAQFMEDNSAMANALTEMIKRARQPPMGPFKLDDELGPLAKQQWLNGLKPTTRPPPIRGR